MIHPIDTEQTCRFKGVSIIVKTIKYFHMSQLATAMEKLGSRLSTFTPLEAGMYILLLLTALTMRIWDLDSRAFHHDESLHALYAFNLSNGLGYAHNPMMHGPLQMEATAAIFLAFGDSDFTARLLYAITGTALVTLPILMRDMLGRVGSVMASAMFAFSPAMLYFSRFARNDILMAFWTLCLVICMWKYLITGKTRFLYVGAGFLALAFSTKENAYVITFILGLYLVLLLSAQIFKTSQRVHTKERIRVPITLINILVTLFFVGMQRLRRNRLSRQGIFLAMLFTLSLPMGAALVSLVQNTIVLRWSGLLLAQPVGVASIGSPKSGGLVIAALVIGLLIWLSSALGSRWLKSIWWRCAIIFYSIWILLYTTFLTNIIHGISSGMWQSLGYWLAQQGIGRGGQPFYYYLIITPLYEFLPLVFAIPASIYYIKSRSRFGIFLVFWAITTIAIYSYMSEKMPWLLVNITLPIILLSAKFLGTIVCQTRWAKIAYPKPILLILGLALSICFSCWAIVTSPEDSHFLYKLLLLILITASVSILGFLTLRLIGIRDTSYLVAIAVGSMMFFLTIFVGYRATYLNSDVPTEMLVYTQTSPELAQLYKYITHTGDLNTPILIDQTNGFSWPWAWYLRNHSNVRYSDSSIVNPTQSVVILHSSNLANNAPELLSDYSDGVRIPHRAWFPESYKNLTTKDVLANMSSSVAWENGLKYFLFRTLTAPIGSEDTYVYFGKDSKMSFDPPQ